MPNSKTLSKGWRARRSLLSVCSQATLLGLWLELGLAYRQGKRQGGGGELNRSPPAAGRSVDRSATNVERRSWAVLKLGLEEELGLRLELKLGLAHRQGERQRKRGAGS